MITVSAMMARPMLPIRTLRLCRSQKIGLVRK